MIRFILNSSVASHGKVPVLSISSTTLRPSSPSARPNPMTKGKFRAYLRRGILAHGFARARCGDCGHELLIRISICLPAIPVSPLVEEASSRWDDDRGGIRRGVRPRAAGSSAHRADASGVVGFERAERGELRGGRSTRMGLPPKEFQVRAACTKSPLIPMGRLNPVWTSTPRSDR